MSEIKLVLTQLAEFHASSYHYLQNYEGGVEQFMRDFPVSEKTITRLRFWNEISPHFLTFLHYFRKQ